MRCGNAQTVSRALRNGCCLKPLAVGSKMTCSHGAGHAKTTQTTGACNNMLRSRVSGTTRTLAQRRAITASEERTIADKAVENTKMSEIVCRNNSARDEIYND